MRRALIHGLFSLWELVTYLSKYLLIHQHQIHSAMDQDPQDHLQSCFRYRLHTSIDIPYL